MSQVSTPQSKLYTARDIEKFDSQGKRYELIAGELLPMSPTNGYHGIETMELAGALWAYVRPMNLGRIYAAETGFRLSQNPDTILAPDIAYVRAERVTTLSHDGYVECVPDLVVETRSPSDTKRKIAVKLQRWLDFGVPMVLDLDPASRILNVLRPDHDPIHLDEDGSFDGLDVLPGFNLQLSRVFF